MTDTMRRLMGAAVLMLISSLALPAAAETGSPERTSSDPKAGKTVHHVDEISETFSGIHALVARAYPQVRGRGINDEHASGGRHSDHQGRQAKRRHGGEHDRHRDHEKSRDAAGQGSRPNNVLNLILVLLIPAAVGAIGGRVLRARTLSPAS